MNDNNNLVQWNPAEMLEVVLNEPDDFLKVIFCMLLVIAVFIDFWDNLAEYILETNRIQVKGSSKSLFC